MSPYGGLCWRGQVLSILCKPAFFIVSEVGHPKSVAGFKDGAQSCYMETFEPRAGGGRDSPVEIAV